MDEAPGSAADSFWGGFLRLKDGAKMGALRVALHTVHAVTDLRVAAGRLRYGDVLCLP